MTTFEEYLQEIHSDQYIGIDDDMSDNFDNWLGDLDGEELINFADSYGRIKYREGKLAGMDRALGIIRESK